jgi:hypothetical protein
MSASPTVNAAIGGDMVRRRTGTLPMVNASSYQRAKCTSTLRLELRIRELTRGENFACRVACHVHIVDELFGIAVGVENEIWIGV